MQDPRLAPAPRGIVAQKHPTSFVPAALGVPPGVSSYVQTGGGSQLSSMNHSQQHSQHSQQHSAAPYFSGQLLAYPANKSEYDPIAAALSVSALESLPNGFGG